MNPKVAPSPNLEAVSPPVRLPLLHLTGHDVIEIAKALDIADTIDGPVCIIADTIKSKGIDFAEDRTGFHKSFITSDQYEKYLEVFKS